MVHANQVVRDRHEPVVGTLGVVGGVEKATQYQGIRLRRRALQQRASGWCEVVRSRDEVVQLGVELAHVVDVVGGSQHYVR